MVGHIDDFAEVNKGNDSKKSDNKKPAADAGEESDKDEEVAAVHINNRNEQNMSEEKIETPEPVQTPTTSESSGYNAIIASIVAGDKISENIDGIDLNEIPFNDQPLGEFACAVVLKCDTNSYSTLDYKWAEKSHELQNCLCLPSNKDLILRYQKRHNQRSWCKET